MGTCRDAKGGVMAWRAEGSRGGAAGGGMVCALSHREYPAASKRLAVVPRAESGVRRGSSRVAGRVSSSTACALRLRRAGGRASRGRAGVARAGAAARVRMRLCAGRRRRGRSWAARGGGQRARREGQSRGADGGNEIRAIGLAGGWDRLAGVAQKTGRLRENACAAQGPRGGKLQSTPDPAQIVLESR